MSGIPQEVIDDLTKFAEENNTPLDEVKKMFKTEYNADYMSSYDEENGERAKQAAYVVRAELMDKFGGNVVYEGVVFQTTEPVEKEQKKDPTKTYVSSSIMGMFKPGDSKGKFVPMNIQCFGDASAMSSTIPINVPIKINVSEKEYNGKPSISISNNIIYTVIETGKVFNMRDFIIESLKNDKEPLPIKIEEVKYRRSKDDDDKKVIKGRVKRSGVKVSSKGNLLSNYTLYDDERGADEVIYISTMLTKQIWETGALVWAVGTNKDPNPQYNNKNESMFADFVVGILPKTVSKEKRESMIANAKKEQFTKSATKVVPSEVPDTPDTSGLEKVIQSGDGPEMNFDSWD